MTVEPLTSRHVLTMALQPSQAYFASSVTAEYAESLVKAGPAFAGAHGGDVVCCAGVLPQWEGRAIGWALMSPTAGPHMLRITRASRRFFDMQQIRRIETWVDPMFPAAVRWIEMLGFKREGCMVKYTPLGGDADLYARILWDKH